MFANLEDGVEIELDDSAPALRQCRYCASKRGYLTGSSGPHNEGVRCAECGRHLGWLPKNAAEDDFDLFED